MSADSSNALIPFSGDRREDAERAVGFLLRSLPTVLDQSHLFNPRFIDLKNRIIRDKIEYYVDSDGGMYFRPSEAFRGALLHSLTFAVETVHFASHGIDPHDTSITFYPTAIREGSLEQLGFSPEDLPRAFQFVEQLRGQNHLSFSRPSGPFLGVLEDLQSMSDELMEWIKRAMMRTIRLQNTNWVWSAADLESFEHIARAPSAFTSTSLAPDAVAAIEGPSSYVTSPTPRHPPYSPLDPYFSPEEDHAVVVYRAAAAGGAANPEPPVSNVATMESDSALVPHVVYHDGMNLGGIVYDPILEQFRDRRTGRFYQLVPVTPPPTPAVTTIGTAGSSS